MKAKAVSLSSLMIVWVALAIGSVAWAQDTNIRIAAANASSGPSQSYDPGHGIRILKALKPDVVLIQEFRYRKGTLRDLVNQIADSKTNFYVEPGYRLPNGIISRFPIKESGTVDDTIVGDRGYCWARITLPGGKDLLAVSVHFKASSGSESARTAQAQELVRFLDQKMKPGDYLVIGGDFNTRTRGEPCLQELSEVVETGGPYPVDQQGNGNTSANRSKPYDWVLANKELDTIGTTTQVGAKQFPDGLVFDSRVSPALVSAGEVYPGDSGSDNMQHMVVVRDFKVRSTRSR